MIQRLDRLFYERDVLDVAPSLLGCYLTLRRDDGIIDRYMITETEAYRGEADKACHASRGRTTRTEIMYSSGGHIYIYLIYGMYWMFNIVTSRQEIPQAVLIRGVKGADGPGKMTKKLMIDKSYYGINLITSSGIWVEAAKEKIKYIATPRIGVNYAESPWREKKWRYLMSDQGK